MTRLQKDAIFKIHFLNMEVKQKGFNAGPWIGEKQVSPRCSLRKQIRLAKDVDWRKRIFCELGKNEIVSEKNLVMRNKKAWEQSRCKVEEFAANCKSELVQDGDIAKAAGSGVFTPNPLLHHHSISSANHVLQFSTHGFFWASGTALGNVSCHKILFGCWWQRLSCFSSNQDFRLLMVMVQCFWQRQQCSNPHLALPQLVQQHQSPGAVCTQSASWCTTLLTKATYCNSQLLPASPPRAERNQLKNWFWWDRWDG